MGVPYVCYSIIMILSRIVLVWSRQYSVMLLLSYIYCTEMLVGIETLWSLPSIFIAELLLNQIYGRKVVTTLSGSIISIICVLFMSPAGLDSVIPLFKFRMPFGFNQGIGNLDKKRFQITANVGNTSGLYLLAALVIAGTAASPGNKMFG